MIIVFEYVLVGIELVIVNVIGYIMYFIVVGNIGDVFEVGKFGGDVIIKLFLDYEEWKNYILIVGVKVFGS